MKKQKECYECLRNQASKISELTYESEKQRRILLKNTRKFLDGNFHLDVSAIELFKKLHEYIYNFTNIKDPYHDIKKMHNDMAIQLLPFVEELVANSDDSFHTMIKVIIISNIVDYAQKNPTKDLRQFLVDKLNLPIKGNSSVKQFKASLDQADTVLYLSDNCGEILMDISFINNFLSDKHVILALRDAPAINDMTLADLQKLIKQKQLKVDAKLISTGVAAPGIIFSDCTTEFKSLFKNCDIVIAKGQGNFESLTHGLRDNLYSLFIAKCETVSKLVNANKGELILYKFNTTTEAN